MPSTAASWLRSLKWRLNGSARQRAHGHASKLLFSFEGGSGARPEMGQALYATRAAFRESIDATSAIVESILQWSCARTFHEQRIEDCAATPEQQRRNELVRLGALQVAQLDLWREQGIVPDGVCGVSLGEMVMPYAAGILSRNDTARVLAVTSAAISRTRVPSVLFQLHADESAARRLCDEAPAPLQFLGATGPAATLALSSPADAETLRCYLARHITRELASDWNYHTPSLPVDRTWMQQLSNLRSGAPRIPIFSSIVGDRLPADVRLDGDYFATLVSQPFHFARAASAAIAAGFDLVVNVGPKAGVSHQIAALARLQDRDIRVLRPLDTEDECGAWDRVVQEVRRAGLPRSSGSSTRVTLAKSG